VPIIDRPWSRVRVPVPIPAPLSAEALTVLSRDELAELIRSNFVPRADLPSGRAAWEQLWGTLKSVNDLSDLAYDVLEEFLDATEKAMQSGQLDEVESGRARKFKSRCDEAWMRLDRFDDGDAPLAWAGKAGEFQPSARRVIAILVGSIARHRAAVQREHTAGSDADTQLWASLRRVGLDPLDYGPRGSAD
jgi:hypothetical protein